MLSTRVELRSGAWEWSRQPLAAGEAIVFRHCSRGGETMRNWSSRTPTPEELAALALDPTTRTWVGPLGVRWELSLKTPLSWRRKREGSAPRELWLVFADGVRRRVVLVPEATQLGALTAAELHDLLAQALDEI
jgi:hypothetical protein